jgi:adenosylmethionine-8-amino-7-oxononanoate aminotransferase
VLLRPLGNVLYMVPPYIIQSADLHHAYDAITKALS